MNDRVLTMHYKLNIYKLPKLNDHISHFPHLHILASEVCIINHADKTMSRYASNKEITLAHIDNFDQAADLRLSGKLPDICLYSDLIQQHDNVLRSRDALDFCKKYRIKNILTFHKKYKDGDIYFSFAVDTSNSLIAKYFIGYQHLMLLINDCFADLKDQAVLLKTITITPDYDAIFTSTQWHIFKSILNGESFSEIADANNISKRTVEKHVERIRKKCNCYSTSSLIARFSFLQNMNHYDN